MHGELSLLYDEDGSGGEVPGNDNGLTSEELLSSDLLGRQSLELSGEFLDSDGRESFLLRWGASG